MVIQLLPFWKQVFKSKGKVMHHAKLIAISKTIGELVHLTPEEFIVYCARVSSPNNQKNLNTSLKLLKYLIKHGHYSPMQMVTVTLEVTTTRAISRQLLRHRSLNFQEFSGRYAEMNGEIIRQECRLQDSKNRQNSLNCEDLSLSKAFKFAQEDLWQKAYALYKNALLSGVAKECARSLLPEGLVESKLYVTATIRDIMFYLKQRLDPSTQKEHRQLAESIRDALSVEFPTIIEAVLCD